MTALPMSAAILASFAQLCFDTLVRAALVLVLIITFRQWPDVAIVDLLLCLVFAFLLLFFAWSCFVDFEYDFSQTFLG